MTHIGLSEVRFLSSSGGAVGWGGRWGWVGLPSSQIFYQNSNRILHQCGVFSVTTQPATAPAALEGKAAQESHVLHPSVTVIYRKISHCYFGISKWKRRKGQHHERTMTSRKDWPASKLNPWLNYMRLSKTNRHLFPTLLFGTIAMHRNKGKKAWCVNRVCPRSRKQAPLRGLLTINASYQRGKWRHRNWENKQSAALRLFP